VTRKKCGASEAPGWQGAVFYRPLPAGFKTGSARTLLQIDSDRLQIEVNHREEKDTLGVGQAQRWNEVSVPKQPVLAVAAYKLTLSYENLTSAAAA
jgi:hypothetical protein